MLLALAAFAVVAAGCWDRGATSPKSNHFPQGRYALHLGGQLHVGDKIVCLAAGVQPRSLSVPERSVGVGSVRGDFDVTTSPSGKVEVTCLSRQSRPITFVLHGQLAAVRCPINRPPKRGV
jgi:hypothetical protein